ncbi:MAG: DUF4340 domain-containing protein [Betaproteobacteria bacterium]|nr:DUF4340 domain-containing protein [Betaproteobacteria bacterium]
MNLRIVVILLVLGLVMAGAALVVHQREASTTPAGQLGQPLLKNLKASDVASISIREPKSGITLEKKGERWSVAERNGFPADLAKVSELVIKAIGLRVGQSEPLGEKDRVRLELAEPGKDGAGTLVEYRGADGKPLARLLVGKKYFKSEPENPARALADGRFVLLPEDPKIVYTVADPLAFATAKTSEWVSREGVAIERIKSLEVKLAGGETWKIERASDGPDWKLAGAKPGDKLDTSRANAASYSLNSLAIEDLAASAKPEDNGLDKPELVTAATFEGLTYTLRIGKLADDKYPVQVQVEGALEKSDKPDAKKPERLERERSLKDFVVLIQKSKLADTLKKRGELLEQKKQGTKK